MARGKPTSPELIEKAKVIFAKTNNAAEVARQTGLPKITAYDNVTNVDDFESYRTKIRVKFIKEASQPLLDTVYLLNQKIAELKEKPNLNSTTLRELAGSVRDLKQAVENVGNVINIDARTQTVNNYSPTPQQEYEAALEVLSEHFHLDGKEIIKRIERK